MPALDLAPGETETRLAELKHTCSETYYRTGTRQRQFTRAVDRKAGELMGDYQKKADRMDNLLGGGGEGGEGGSVRRRLDLFGELITVVVGKHNELSEGGHMLIEAMASCRVDKMERRTGMASQDMKKEQGVIQGELRRQLSVVNIRASMACLLDRLHQCGEGGRLRNRREEWRVREEERMREERELHFANRLKGRSLLQPGRILHRH